MQVESVRERHTQRVREKCELTPKIAANANLQCAIPFATFIAPRKVIGQPGDNSGERWVNCTSGNKNTTVDDTRALVRIN